MRIGFPNLIPSFDWERAVVTSFLVSVNPSLRLATSRTVHRRTHESRFNYRTFETTTGAEVKASLKGALKDNKTLCERERQ